MVIHPYSLFSINQLVLKKSIRESKNNFIRQLKREKKEKVNKDVA